MDNKLSLFAAGYVQVLLIAINTWQIAHSYFIGAFIVALLISLVWTYNVKRISLSSMTDRFLYSFGAAFGTLSGMGIVKVLY